MSNYGGENWTAGISGEKLLSEINIPEKSIQEIERAQMARLKAKTKKGTIMLDE